MNHWCESCARKNLCYVVDARPKCFVPITSNDRTADRKTEPIDKDINVRSKTEPSFKVDGIGDDDTTIHAIAHLQKVGWLQEHDRALTEPQKDLLVTEYPQDGEVNLIGRDKTEAVVMAYDVYKELTEPQTEMEKSGSRAVQTARCLNCHNAKACKENHWEVCKYEPWKLIAVEDEPQTDIGTSDTVYSDTAGYVPRVDMTDCSWKKGE